MGLVTTHRDTVARRLTLVTELAATPARVWDLWASPELFSRWWGPPGVTLVVDRHELSPGGGIRFHVDAAGARIDGHLDVRSIRPPRHLSLTFHGEGLEPISLEVAIDDVGADLTRMTIVATFLSDEAMGAALDIGVDRGFATAVGRIDEVLLRP